MKKPFYLAAVLTTMALTLGACSQGGDSTASSASESASSAVSTAAASGELQIEDNHGTQTIQRPVERVVATDNRAFEILDNWGVNLVAAPKPIVPFTVEHYKNNDDIVDLGSHRDPNLEAIVAANPDLIINGQRFARQYDAIKELTPDVPIIELDPREDQPLDSELKRQVKTLGEVFGKESEADKLIADFEAAVERAKKAYDPSKKVMAVNVSGGEIGYIAPHKGRTYGAIFDLLGLTPALEVENASDNHKGDDISVEAIAQSDPDIILVMDRDAAIKRGDKDYQPAKNVIENNDLLKNVKAIKGKAVYYAPDDTYTNENIITYTEILNEMADLFESQK
ncbi:ABC transporter substrate-binding protein [Corynebacterium uropygiale]|uniref:ABC transporter substrate-binding protein n=1 Tax=Corynebacterium uropygiale TaxID=1775911 RepID=A0A9X1U1H6_9CORY|nr:ABC transporter substrate-binding protein [Corynebacterium uropygiale]MCF4007578.1 ABC transporter substrate-binding protein [Corynebacterium uropygiale]